MPERQRRRSHAGFALTVGLAVFACACQKERDPVQRFLAELTKAVEERDADAVVKHLAPDFRGQGGIDRAGAGAELRRYFLAYSSLDVTLSGVAAEAGTEGVRVRFRADLSGRARPVAGLQDLLPAASAYSFDLQLKGAPGEFTIAQASWERLELR